MTNALPGTVGELGEFGLIDVLARLVAEEGVGGDGTRLGIGDDAAILRQRAEWDLLVTCDALVEGRHWLRGGSSWGDVGRRVMAANVSDIGAMGGRPNHALVSLGLRPELPVADVVELYRGMLEELAPFGAALVGGNVTHIDGPVFIDVTLLGEVEADKALRRDGARAGDVLLLVGMTGLAAAGLRCLLDGEFGRPDAERLIRAHRVPEQRAEEGRRAAGLGGVTAAVDTSDGLAGDLAHLCEASGVGARLVAEQVPVHRALRAWAERRGEEVLTWVLGPSDDYQLLLAVAPERERVVVEALRACRGTPVTRIGEITGDRGEFVLVTVDGARGLDSRGWDHFGDSVRVRPPPR